MFPVLKEDIRRNLRDYLPASPLRRLLLCLTLNSIHAVVLIRFQFWCAAHRLPGIFASKLLFWFFKIEISSRSRIGPGLRLPHPMGIIIAPNATIGRDCDFYADVRLVLAHGDPKGPTIGDHVLLGDGVKVVGNLSVGDHCILGISSVVTKDIPAGSTAAGVPARVLNSDNGRAADPA